MQLSILDFVVTSLEAPSPKREVYEEGTSSSGSRGICNPGTHKGKALYLGWLH